MAKSQNGSSFQAELFKFTLYKRNQGRLVRQMTAVAVGVLIFFGSYTLSKGPLSSYVDSYLTMSARYPADQLDAGRDQKLQALAEKNGGNFAGADQGQEYRVLEFRFSTSQGWETDQELVREMGKAGRQFAADVDAEFATKVRVSKPKPQSRRAVGISIGIPVILCLLGFWITFRAVNFPRFADFLISVEAEMDKVSWPGRQELYRSTAVVVSTMFFLGFLLLSFDVFWKYFFELIGFLRISSPT